MVSFFQTEATCQNYLLESRNKMIEVGINYVIYNPH